MENNLEEKKFPEKIDVCEKIEQFYADIIKMNEVFRITIPKNVIDGADLKAGQKLKVIIQTIQ